MALKKGNGSERMQDIRVCLALSHKDRLVKLKAFLTSKGFHVIDESVDGQSALRRIRMLRPDLVIADYELPGMNGITLAKICDEDNISPVILIQPVTKQIAWTDNIFPVISEPLSKSVILQTISVVLTNHQRISRLKNEIKKLKSSLESRKIIEKAKGILMKKYSITEDEAYRKLQKSSMDKGVPMDEIASAVVTAYEL